MKSEKDPAKLFYKEVLEVKSLNALPSSFSHYLHLLLFSFLKQAERADYMRFPMFDLIFSETETVIIP